MLPLGELTKKFLRTIKFPCGDKVYTMTPKSLVTFRFLALRSPPFLSPFSDVTFAFSRKFLSLTGKFWPFRALKGLDLALVVYWFDPIYIYMYIKLVQSSPIISIQNLDPS